MGSPAHHALNVAMTSEESHRTDVPSVEVKLLPTKQRKGVFAMLLGRS